MDGLSEERNRRAQRNRVAEPPNQPRHQAGHATLASAPRFFQYLRTHIIKEISTLPAHVDACHRTDRHRRARRSLDPRRDVDAIAEDVVIVENDVPDVDSDAKLDSTILRQDGVPLSHTTLHFDRAPHRIDGAAKLHKHAISGGLDHTTAVFGYLGVNKFPSKRL